MFEIDVFNICYLQFLFGGVAKFWERGKMKNWLNCNESVSSIASMACCYFAFFKKKPPGYNMN